MESLVNLIQEKKNGPGTIGVWWVRIRGEGIGNGTNTIESGQIMYACFTSSEDDQRRRPIPPQRSQVLLVKRRKPKVFPEPRQFQQRLPPILGSPGRKTTEGGRPPGDQVEDALRFRGLVMQLDWARGGKGGGVGKGRDG